MADAGISTLFNREQLFGEVWTAPMVRVGEKYGISGADVRRVCDALHVPVPAPGHWTRVELGRAVARPALPPMSAQQIMTATSAIEAVVDRPRRGVGVRTRERARRNASDLIETAQERQDWHRAIKGLRDQMAKDASRADRLKKRHEWEQAHPGKRYPPDTAATYGSWEYFCDAGQLLLTATHRKLVARLSLGSYKRGLSVLNIICHSAGLGGYAVEMTNGDERLKLSKDGAYVEIRVTEKLTRDTRYRINSWDKSREPVRTLTPTGKLALFVEQQGTGHTELPDLPDQPLECQLERILAAIDYRHRGSLERIIEWAERDRKWKEAEISRQEDERQRKEAKRKVEEEARRREALLLEVESWQRAELIRAYLALLDSRLGSAARPADGYSAWREWAATVADELDPTRRRVSSMSTDRD
ncbi:hypothetical protein LFL96_01195 [Paraburkholderia sp. D15]|uniref:hypothetical protein n=1 Tax=Paraburkholderia sp. D15 TaxID=2880218 RepID=UPI002478DC5D|nr:hypothetical protein [Paraburkholderia sp. D15]WGS50154.1 hypothetical protein LFL96_01195 [Paraburkholderia sp. D15]